MKQASAVFTSLMVLAVVTAGCAGVSRDVSSRVAQDFGAAN